MRMYRYLAVAAVAALTTIAGTPATAAPSIAAVNVLTFGGVVTNVPVGDTLAASLRTGTSVTFFSTAGGSTGVTCHTSTFSATVTGNPVTPGTATESLNTQTFSDCVENIIGVTSVVSVAVNNLPYGTTVNGTTKVVTVSGTAAAPIQTTVRLQTILSPNPITCVYRSAGTSITGTASNIPDNSITFTSQQFNRFSGPSICFANGFFSAIYAPVRDTSQAGSPVVFTN
jgi:hypothetical protein